MKVRIHGWYVHEDLGEVQLLELHGALAAVQAVDGVYRVRVGELRPKGKSLEEATGGVTRDEAYERLLAAARAKTNRR